MLDKRPNSLITFLRSVPVLGGLEGHSLEILFDLLEERSLSRGEHLQRGRARPHAVRDARGRGRGLAPLASGKKTVIVNLGPGETFGEMALVELQPRTPTWWCEEAVTYSLTNPELWHLYKPDNFAYVIILQNICRMLSRRLRKADGRIVEFVAHGNSARARQAPAKKKKTA